MNVGASKVKPGSSKVGRGGELDYNFGLWYLSSALHTYIFMRSKNIFTTSQNKCSKIKRDLEKGNEKRLHCKGGKNLFSKERWKVL